MKGIFVFVICSIFCIHLYAEDYSFRMPVECNVVLVDDGQAYIAKIALKKTTAYSEARNIQADYAYSDVILNKTLAKHLNVQKGYAVAYSGRVMLGRTQGKSPDEAVYTYKVQKDSILIKKTDDTKLAAAKKSKPEGGAAGNAAADEGYFCECKSELVSSINGYQNALLEKIDEMDSSNVVKSVQDFKKLYGEAMGKFDESKLRHKYNTDEKLTLSDTKVLLNTVKNALENFNSINKILEIQQKIALMPYSEKNTKTVMNLFNEANKIKSSLLEIR